MKKSVWFSFLILSIAVLIQAQPQGFSYQALVRDGAGTAVRNQPVSVRIMLFRDSATGTRIYREFHSPTTNNFGNINLVIGKGGNTTGVFSSINWGAAPYFINLAVDITGGVAYTDLGTTQLMGVPYAMYSGSSGSTAIDSIQLLTITNDTLHLSRNGGDVKLPIPPYISVSAAEFVPYTSTVTYSSNGPGLNDRFIEYPQGSKQYLIAPLNLPNGARVTNLNCNVWDQASTLASPYDSITMTVGFYKAGNGAVCGPISSSSVGGSNKILSSSCNVIINNQTGFYNLLFSVADPICGNKCSIIGCNITLTP